MDIQEYGVVFNGKGAISNEGNINISVISGGPDLKAHKRLPPKLVIETDDLTE